MLFWHVCRDSFSPFHHQKVVKKSLPTRRCVNFVAMKFAQTNRQSPGGRGKNCFVCDHFFGCFGEGISGPRKFAQIPAFHHHWFSSILPFRDECWMNFEIILKNWNLQNIRGLTVFFAELWDLQTITFEIPWFLGRWFLCRFGRGCLQMFEALMLTSLIYFPPDPPWKKKPVQSSKRRKKNTLTIIGTSKKHVFDCVFRRSFLDRQTTRHLRSRLILTRMSHWKLGSMVHKWFISPTYKWGIPWVYSPLTNLHLWSDHEPNGTSKSRLFFKKLFQNPRDLSKPRDLWSMGPLQAEDLLGF